MKALVTGGAGFIGSHIVDILVSNGYDVVVVDNLVTGNKKNLSEKAVFYEADITDNKALNEVFEKEKPDYVLHQAAQVNVRKSIEDPVFDMESNIHGVINILECCRKFAVEKLLFSSSGGAVYGEPQNLPCSESHSTEPICHYGVSKLSGEYYIKLYASLYKLNYTILRYANVYGPRQDPKGEAGVVAIFNKLMSEGKEISIFGDGEQTRDFVFVEDVARANLLALESDSKSRIFNIGTGKQTSVNQVYAELNKIINKHHKKKNSPPVPGEVRHIYSNISLAEKELGWKPEVSLPEGLKMTAEFFKG